MVKMNCVCICVQVNVKLLWIYIRGVNCVVVICVCVRNILELFDTEPKLKCVRVVAVLI